MVVKAYIENEASVQAKVPSEIFRSSLCSAVFIGLEEEKFFLVLASLSSKPGLGCVC